MTRNKKLESGRSPRLRSLARFISRFARIPSWGWSAAAGLRAILRDEPTGFNRYLGPADNSKESGWRGPDDGSCASTARPMRSSRGSPSAGPRSGRADLHDLAPPGVTSSDGTPFTSADVLFAFEAVYSNAANSAIGTA